MLFHYKNINIYTVVINSQDPTTGVVWGRKGWTVGIDMTKGFHYTELSHHFEVTSFSRDGVYLLVKKEFSDGFFHFLKYFILARLLAFFNMLFYYPFVPFALLYYLVYMLGYFCFIIAMFPFMCCCWDKFKNLIKNTFATFFSILAIIFSVLLSPIFILLPEVAIHLFKMHHWGCFIDYCYEKYPEKLPCC